MKLLAIIGAGDLGQLIAYHASLKSDFKVVGYYDDSRPKGQLVNSFPVLGDLSEIDDHFEKGLFSCLMIGIGYNHMAFRRSCFVNFKSKIPFASIVHDSVIVDSSANLGEGVFILPGCVLDQNVTIGENVLLNTGCVIAHDSIVKSHSFLSPAVAMAGKSIVGESCIIGINTTIIDNVTISDEIRTGGGSVVIENLDRKGLYVGVPARFKRAL